MTKVSKELYDSLGKLLRFFRQPPGGGGGRRGAENKAQMRVLQFLALSETAKTTGEIAEKLEIRQQSASELVSKLAKKSWIDKTKDSQDKRVTLVSLTAEGREMTKAMTKREGDYYQQFFDVLTDEEQAELNRLVKKLFDGKFEQHMPNRKGGLITAMKKREQMKRELLEKK